MSKLLNLPDRGARECKSILISYDNLEKTDINERCVTKLLAEKSISLTARVICSLNYCSDADKQLFIDNKISATELYNSKQTVSIDSAVSLKERAKRLKDDSESCLSYKMVTDMFVSETKSYLESICIYIQMIENVTDKRYTKDEAMIDINLAYDAVNKAVTSLKEAIINTSNKAMEE